MKDTRTPLVTVLPWDGTIVELQPAGGPAGYLAEMDVITLDVQIRKMLRDVVNGDCATMPPDSEGGEWRITTYRCGDTALDVERVDGGNGSHYYTVREMRPVRSITVHVTTDGKSRVC